MRPLPFSSVPVAAFAAFLLLVAPSTAQTVTGSITGAVQDESGSSVPGAALKLVSESTSAIRSILSDQSGNFVFNAVPPGVYTLHVQQTGFKEFQRTGIELAANQSLTI